MEKYEKPQVAFERKASHKDHCGICVHFRPPHGCAVVKGEIWPESWCKKFKHNVKAKTTLAELK